MDTRTDETGHDVIFGRILVLALQRLALDQDGRC
jgi:hypothetical protein